MESQQELNNSMPIPVDLGLPSGTLWADRNVGANSPEDYGAFFLWGNTEPHFPKADDTDWGDNDEAFNEEIFDGDAYENSQGYQLNGDLDEAHDAAAVNCGEPWRMPSKVQFQELYDNCLWTRKTRGGVNGYLVTSKFNGKSLFFPCSGYGYGASWGGRGSGGLYWSSSFYSARSAWHLYFGSSGVNPQSYSLRYNGRAVRPVQNTSAQ